MPPGDFRVTVKGLKEWHAGLRTLQEPYLSRVVDGAMRQAMQQTIVPAIKAAAPIGPAPHKSAARGTRGKKGPLNRTVTVRKNQKRYARSSAEMVSMNAGPRAWYRHFVIKGTQPHGLLKGARVRTGYLQSESKARGPMFWHVGSRANNFVVEAVTGKEGPLAKAMGDAVIARYQKAVRP